jgi:hypothetical protein
LKIDLKTYEKDLGNQVLFVWQDNFGKKYRQQRRSGLDALNKNEKEEKNFFSLFYFVTLL